MICGRRRIGSRGRAPRSAGKCGGTTSRCGPWSVDYWRVWRWLFSCRCAFRVGATASRRSSETLDFSSVFFLLFCVRSTFAREQMFLSSFLQKIMKFQTLFRIVLSLSLPLSLSLSYSQVDSARDKKMRRGALVVCLFLVV